MSSAVPKSIRILLGERTLVQQRIDEWLKELLPNGQDNTNYVTFDAAEDDPHKIVTEAMTVSLFSTQKVLLVRGLERADASFYEQLKRLKIGISSSITLLLTGTGWPSKASDKKAATSFQKSVKKVAYIERMALKSFNPHQYVRTRAKELKMRFNHQAISQLVQDSKSPSFLENELLKLSCFVEPGEMISLEHLEKICDLSAEGNMWDLTKAIAQKNYDLALSTLHRLLKEEKAPHWIFGTILWQMRQLTILQQHLSEGAPLDGAWSNGRQRQEATRVLKKSPINSAKLLSRLLTTNRHFNSSKSGAELHLHALVIELCSV